MNKPAIMNCLLENRVEKIRISRKDALLPLLEAINNSMQSLALSHQKDPQINIEIQRDPSLIEDSGCVPISSISIIDNGAGFNDDNFNSFSTLDSNYKKSIGGKGVGRLFWLYAFNKVTIRSIYLKDNLKYRRTFKFDKTKAVYDEENIVVNSNEPVLTEIKMENPTSEYSKISLFTENDIYSQLSIKFLSYILQNSCPKIMVKIDSADPVDLVQFTSSIIEEESKDYPIEVNGNQLKGKGYLVKDPSGQHLLLICAQGITVKEIKLSDLLDLPYSFAGDTKIKFFVSGEALDKDVNESRTDFSTFTFSKCISLNQELNLYDAVIFALKDFVNPLLKEHKKEKVTKAISYIEKEEPQYSYLINKPSLLENIPMRSIEDKSKLTIELYKIDNDQYKQCQNKMDTFLNKKDLIEPDEIEKLTKMVSESAKTDLTRYVIRRKKIIELLGKLLELYAQGKYHNETILHNLFVPQRLTSADLSYNDHNLWLIDERLAFDYSIFSDKTIKEITGDESASSDRPDVLFSGLLPLAKKGEENQSVQNIIILEFKKPGRDDYSASVNPIDQVLNYVSQLKEHETIKGVRRNIIHINSNATFCAYIIADLTPSLQKIAKEKDFLPLPEENGYYQYHRTYKAYIEIMPYSKIKNNAEIRNKAFLDKIREDIDSEKIK